MENKIVTRKYEFHDKIVYVDTINTKKEFKWRLRGKDWKTEWTSHYEGVLTAAEMHIGYASAYWDGVLPIEIPFLIVPLEEIK
jgi:hypothetical protein